MPQNNPPQLPHLLIHNTATPEQYTSTATRGPSFHPPTRNRNTHGRNLQAQFNNIGLASTQAIQEQEEFGIDNYKGIYIQFESQPNFELKFESLEVLGSGIELLATKKEGQKNIATIFVPDGKLEILTRKLEAYLDPEKDSDRGKPKNNDLIASIESLKRAALDALWTDPIELLPEDNETTIWWEVWLRATNDPEGVLTFFRNHATRLELRVNDEVIMFPDRIVVAVQGTKSQISRSVKLLNCVAELRLLKDKADFYSAMSRQEQYEWLDSTLDQITPPSSSQPAICILDTGINDSHPLLRPVVQPGDLGSYDPSWGIYDHQGHGTEMAGLAAYGDLTETLATSTHIQLTHGIESVKILPPSGDNDPRLYGSITAECVSRAEVNNPSRNRNFCLAVTTDNDLDIGKPSSWSASIDSLCSGASDEQEASRLIIVSAGNTDFTQRHHYPNNNITEGILDPGQSWNALTIGAYTEKNHIDFSQFPDWNLLAPPGDISPSSRTSMTWSRPWPLKPDFVMEGGNMAVGPTGTADYVDSLQLLSTDWLYHISNPFRVSGDTSAATALAANYAAKLQEQYPNYWPETIRALLVHSSEWTEAMLDRFAPLRTQEEYMHLLRYCGYGIPSINRALWSARNSLTLVAQDTLQPFHKVGSDIKTKDMNLHSIPWPVDILESLGNTDVEMKVTLSYFIEPNPSRRGWAKKYSYASHGLRFDVKRHLESLDSFKQRINRAARDEGVSTTSTAPSDQNWVLGSNLRKLGSIHSDIWKGTAVELAHRGYIGLYPVMGWWRTNKRQECWSKIARYSLIISIKTPETDLYTPISNMIQPEITIAT